MRVYTILKGGQYNVAVQTSESTLAILDAGVFGLRSVFHLIARGKEVQNQITAAIVSGQLKQVDINSVRHG